MRKRFALLLLALTSLTLAGAQTITVKKAAFQKGDNMEWSKPSFDDSKWQQMDVTRNWDDQGQVLNNAFGWYRVHVTIPKSIADKAEQKETILFDLPKMDDAGEVYLNGKLIGKTGGLPGDKGGYRSAWNAPQSYALKLNEAPINWDADNVLAFRVYNAGEPGGLFDTPVTIHMPHRTDGISFAFSEQRGKKDLCTVTLGNSYPVTQKGTVVVTVSDPETGATLSTTKKSVSLKKDKTVAVPVAYDRSKMNAINVTYTDGPSGLQLTKSYIPKYILTPPAPLAPRFNNAPVFGVRPGSPVIYRFPVSGERPMKFTSSNLPEGLTLNAENGALGGKLERRGNYTFTVTAENAHGKASQEFTVRVGSQIALTPPMGWNSWNCWGLSVSQERVMSSAQAIIDKGLADYGYCYINVDDAWEARERNADGTIAVNDKFPDMKGLGDWLHANGLKFGIYSSPGDYTCGGYLGSIDHEKQDAESYNSWGVDYLKYDWCGYGREFDKEKDKNTAAYVRPYLLMEKYLREQPRDIFYSLCQYGMANVWEWGEFVDANSWRTTGDITDTWASMYNIGFVRQAKLYPYAKPGRWNDPDMLIVGKVGWSSNLRDSRLTPDEQYTHITLWTILAANMLIGCDVSQIDDFTIGLLCNNEVNAVHQDILGKQGKPVVIDGDLQIWERELSDGSYALGIFNLGSENQTVDFGKYVKQLEHGSLKSLRDLWRQQDLSTSELSYFIPTHGVKYVKASFK
ncbi:MAG: putative Ig domain-containing protein [Bacteroidaceae bacterium]|nr:putative Ig domain-containing protein [Bacteroidaceae bacterium]